MSSNDFALKEEKKIKYTITKSNFLLIFLKYLGINEFNMINTFNNYSLAIEGSTKKVSIAILNKKKIIKVKYYQSKSNYEDHDTFFVTFTEFLNDSKINVREISSYYVGCGPGSFTGIRKVVAFVKALIISNFRNVIKKYYISFIFFASLLIILTLFGILNPLKNILIGGGVVLKMDYIFFGKNLIFFSIISALGFSILFKVLIDDFKKNAILIFPFLIIYSLPYIILQEYFEPLILFLFFFINQL